MRVVLLSAPGAGKGTQATKIAEHFGVRHISSGDLFREHVRKGTALGRQVQRFLDAGDLVPDAVVMDMLRKPVVAAAEDGGYVLDGFPRTLAQAEAAREIAESLGVAAQAVVYYEVPEEELIRRLLARAHQDGRVDDNEATIRHRLEVFDEKTRPLVEYYRDLGVLVPIDGNQAVEQVTEQTLAALEAVRARA